MLTKILGDSMRKGDSNYAMKDEKLDKKRDIKTQKNMGTAGIATKLKKNGKEKLIKVKPMKKV